MGVDRVVLIETGIAHCRLKFPLETARSIHVTCEVVLFFGSFPLLLYPFNKVYQYKTSRMLESGAYTVTPCSIGMSGSEYVFATLPVQS